MTKKKRYPVTLLFLGPCYMVGQKVGYEYALVTADDIANASDGSTEHEELSKSIRIYGGIGKHDRAGMLFTIDATTADCGSVFSSSKQYLGMWGDAHFCAGHRALQDDFNAHHQNVRAEKKARGTDPLATMMQPIIEVYSRLPAPSRAQYLARVVRYLSAGVK